MKKGFACGVFDLFHAGHVLMLQECREHCDYLVVAVNSCADIDYTINPGKKPPIFTLEERKMILNSCKYVDEVLEYNTEQELTDLLSNGNYQIRFLGEDYKGKPITAPNLVPEIYYTNRNHGLSTSGYRKKIVGG
ncbi:MAG: adenylyltransferase/cytidyltransferase family protein [Bacteroidia bacterium]|nr:adenylyltransferase/cytidyltransferase family protein [Bacteroidia bacterium]